MRRNSIRLSILISAAIGFITYILVKTQPLHAASTKYNVINNILTLAGSLSAFGIAIVIFSIDRASETGLRGGNGERLLYASSYLVVLSLVTYISGFSIHYTYYFYDVSVGLFLSLVSYAILLVILSANDTIEKI